MKQFRKLNCSIRPLLLGLFLLVFAGCGSSGSDSGTNEPPVISVPEAQTLTQGVALTGLVVNASDANGDVLTFSLSGAPDGLFIDSSTGALAWTPTYDQIGTHNVEISVSDGQTTVSELVTFVVAPANTDNAFPIAGGTLDPLTVPKYVTPLVIPPVMNTTGTDNDYAIAERQFKQQILPGGVWNTLTGRVDQFPATTVWSYGPESDPLPDSTDLGGAAGVAPAANSQFNYPAYTVESRADTPVSVHWVNDLVDAAGNYLPHLLFVDQTLHWANPTNVCADGTTGTDCMGNDGTPYLGPVPMVPHLHGAHVEGHSDGYPEAWWLPAANNIPSGYAMSGGMFDDATGSNAGDQGFANYVYRNDQPATTLWFHDHSLGMTRTNVYVGPAGFWLIRGDHAAGGANPVVDAVDNQATPDPNDGVLPGPAPVAGQAVLELNDPTNEIRKGIREIPLVIQDRSFNADGSLFYPQNRAFFQGLLDPEDLEIDFDGEEGVESDIAPLWNPEAFFNFIVVNGVTWPRLDVAQAQYRLRLLNGCNSRFLNLALVVVDPVTGIATDQEIPMYMFAAEQGALTKVVKVRTGFATPLLGDGTMPVEVAAPDADQALLMGLAERFEVLVDFSGLANGTIVRMINTAPDGPFGGFEGDHADPSTSGQVMQFVVDASLNGSSPTDPGGATPATSPENLVLNPELPLGVAGTTRKVSLNEAMSTNVCAVEDPVSGVITQVPGIAPYDPNATPADSVDRFEADCDAAGGEPFGPAAALLGIVKTLADDGSTVEPDDFAGIPLRWTDNTGASTPVPVTMANGSSVMINVTENPRVGDTEEWAIYNFTEDAHPIHLHLVRFEIVSRTSMQGEPIPNRSVMPWETGFKDMVIAYPDEITTIKAKFDLAGLYVWHCHIVEHEDNEMMRPYVVSP